MREGLERRLREGADPDDALTELTDALAAAVADSIDGGASKIGTTLRRTSPGLLRWRRRTRRRFRRGLDSVWGDVFDLLEIVIHGSWEIGASIRHEGPAEQKDHRFEALTFLHARACGVAGEIDALLRAGFPSGARARWRTLHELAVIASVIGDGDDELAERYLLHTVVSEYKDSLAHQETEGRAGNPPLDPAVQEELSTAYRILLEQFGQSFRHDWAWACPVVGTDKPTFRDLEKLAGLDHLRTWYRSASHLTHAGSRGTGDIVTPVGGGHILLAGPTNADLGGPAHSTAISLMQVTVTTAFKVRSQIEPHPALMAGIKALQQIVDDVGRASEQAETLSDGYRLAEERQAEAGTRTPLLRSRAIRRAAQIRRRMSRWARRRSHKLSERWPKRDEARPDP